jgi:uncharacterized membrane protein
MIPQCASMGKWPYNCPHMPATRTNKIMKFFVILALLAVLGGWIPFTPPGLEGKADAIGYAFCHRIGERSFHIGDMQLPFCCRCSGMYLGAMTGLAYLAIRGKKKSGLPHWSVMVVLGIFLAAFGVDGLNSYIYLIKSTYPGGLAQIPNIYIPNNTLRLLTGSGMGLGIAAMLTPAFNSSMWADADDHPSLPGLKSFLPLVGLMLVIDGLVLTNSPIILYPLALVSVVGVMVMLTMVYSMLWAMLTRQENTYTRLPQMWMALLAGLTIAMLQVAAIDYLRFWITGTWGAFPLPK